MEASDYTGSDAVAMLLERCAGIGPPIKLLHESGAPRRDTLMPIRRHGSATYVGLLRHELSADREPSATTVRLQRPCYIWDVRHQRYLGHTDRLEMNLDMEPHLLALLPANPRGISISPAAPRAKAGEVVTIDGRIDFDPPDQAAIAELGQVLHVEVFGPAGDELQWYRRNHLIQGDTFRLSLPVSHSEAAGRYTVVVELTVTGATAATGFDVEGG